MEDLLALLVVITACIIALAEVFDKVDTHKEIVKQVIKERKEAQNEM